MPTRKKFQVGDLVEERRGGGKRGVVVYVFGDLTLAGVVAVKFDKQRHPVAVHADDLRRLPKRGRR
jgi:hypothetical protein